MVALEVELAKSKVQKGKTIDRHQQSGKAPNTGSLLSIFFCVAGTLASI